MKLKDAIQNLGGKKATALAGQLADEMGLDWNGDVRHVFKIVANDPDRVPGNIGGGADDERSAIQKWLQKYQAGMEGRASKRISNQSGTIADPIIEEIIGARLAHLTKDDLHKVYVEMATNAFLQFWFDRKDFERDENYKALPLEEQKIKLRELLDMNQLYLNYGDMNDTRHQVTHIEKSLTEKFYGKE